MSEIKKILDGEEFVVQPPEELNLTKQTLNPKLMSEAPKDLTNSLRMTAYTNNPLRVQTYLWL